MGIDVVWKGESGAVLGEVADPHMLLSRFVNTVQRAVPESVCLRFLDPVGDACFNQLQIPVLAQELALAVRAIGEPRLQSHLAQVRALAERANALHTYLWFIGD